MGRSSYLAVSRREGALAGLALVLSVVLPRGRRLPKLCVFNAVTGYPCPFCGLTRGFVDIGHGDLASAERHHPLALPAFGLFMAVSTLSALRGRLRVPVSRRVAAVAAAVLLAAWLVRLLFVPRRHW